MFRTARETLRNSLSRIRNRQFLDATMAATALVAMADGEVTFSELSALDAVLETIQDLQIYDPMSPSTSIGILPMRLRKTPMPDAATQWRPSARSTAITKQPNW